MDPLCCCEGGDNAPAGQAFAAFQQEQRAAEACRAAEQAKNRERRLAAKLLTQQLCEEGGVLTRAASQPRAAETCHKYFRPV